MHNSVKVIKSVPWRLLPNRVSQKIRANELRSSRKKKTQKATYRQHHTKTPGSYQKVCIRAISCGWTWMQNHMTQATINVRCNNEKRERSERTKCTLMPNCWLDDLLRTLNLLPAFWQHINKLSSMRLLHFQFRRLWSRRQGLTRLLYYTLFSTDRFRYIPGSWYFLTVGLYKENQYGLQNQVKIKDGFIFIPSLLKALKKISIFKLVLKKNYFFLYSTKNLFLFMLGFCTPYNPKPFT